MIDILDTQEVLDVRWFNDVGIVTITNGIEERTYVKKVEGKTSKTTSEILSLGGLAYTQKH